MIFLRSLLCLTYLSRVSLGRRVCLLAVLFLISCSSANTVISRATPTATAGPAPVTTPLAPAPPHCDTSPPPQHQHLDSLGMNSNVQLIGGGPFWIYGGYYQSVFHMAQFGYQQWPMIKIVVEVGPNYDQPVTLRLRNVETGFQAWWTDGQMPPGTTTQTLVLNPQTDMEDVGTVPGLPDIPHGSPSPGWKEWGIFPLLSVAGCYVLEVSWSSGSWQSKFAVGN